MKRREFTVGVQLQIIRRATDGAERLHCEQCGRWLTKRAQWEIDHVIPEAMRPYTDRTRALKAADGRLLCKETCHRDKTKRDVGDIAEATRREAAAAGIKAPGKRPWGRPKEPKPPMKVAAGLSALARRGFEPAGKP